MHIHTLKGKGYTLAEENKESWHWHMPFDIETGKTKGNYDGGENYGTLSRRLSVTENEEDASVVSITSATPTVFGFTNDKREQAEDSLVW